MTLRDELTEKLELLDPAFADEILEAIAAGNPTAEELREASDLCWRAKGAEIDHKARVMYWNGQAWMDEGRKGPRFDERPNVAADLQAAETHMVPDDCFWGRDRDTRFWVRRKDNPERPYYSPALSDEKTALALCIASLKAENER